MTLRGRKLAWAHALGAMLSAAALCCAAPLSAQVPAKKPAEQVAPVQLTVLVAKEKATLWINDQEVKERGAQRKVSTVPVKSGARHFVTLKVSWAPNGYTKITRVRKVEVEPGKSYEVNLRARDEKTDSQDEIVVIYVPTPDEIVDHMAKLAGVGKDDVVFDLGCGDGRMVCRAVAKHAAKRGVGIDIDPERIKDSRLTAEQYTVAGSVTFREGDVLRPIKDLHEATVVMLYMGDELGEQLGPILRKTLKPGARVVSHQFHLGDWKPDKTVTVQDKDSIEYKLHLWVVREEAKK